MKMARVLLSRSKWLGARSSKGGEYRMDAPRRDATSLPEDHARYLAKLLGGRVYLEKGAS
jgi:hypothetical protein